MKGPAFQYEVRILRLFRCRRCGRTVRVPGSVASHICRCSDPPTFMTLVDPPKVVSPDVSQFLSTPDAAELAAAEIPETDEPLGPWISRIPVRPPQHPNRRKLSDEFEKHLGEGDPEATPAPETANPSGTQHELPPSQGFRGNRQDHNDRRDRGGRGERSDRGGRADRSDRGDRGDRRHRQDRAARMDRSESNHSGRPPELSPPATTSDPGQPTGDSHANSAPTDHQDRSDQPPRGQRRERNERTDRRDRGPRPDRNPGRPAQRNTPPRDSAPRQQSDEDFGDGIDDQLPADQSAPSPSDDSADSPESSGATPDQARSRRRRRRR